MIRVPFDPDRLPEERKREFDNWCNLAREAKRKLDNDGKLQARIWGILKVWLLKNVFHGKCAYCENNIDASFVGDAEHYRPKGAVTEMRDGKTVRVEKEGRPHPGYYWLAYDWKNLVPSCQLCNAVHGKKTLFPIQGTRVFSEVDGPTTDVLNALEKPFLLHPYDHDPSDHLVFTPDGRVVGLDEWGEKSIEALDLNRAELVSLRRGWIWAQRGRFGSEAGYALANADVGELSARLDAIEASLTSPDQVFSAALRDVIVTLRAQVNVGLERHRPVQVPTNVSSG